MFCLNISLAQDGERGGGENPGPQRREDGGAGEYRRRDYGGSGHRRTGQPTVHCYRDMIYPEDTKKITLPSIFFSDWLCIEKLEKFKASVQKLIFN